MTRPSHDVEIASEPDATRREPASDAVAPPDRSEARSSIARGRDVGDHLVDHPAEAARWTARLVGSYRREVDKPYSGDAVVILPGFAGSVRTDIGSGKAVRGVQRLWETVLSSRAGLSPAVTEDEEDGRRQRLRPTGLSVAPRGFLGSAPCRLPAGSSRKSDRWYRTSTPRWSSRTTGACR